MTHPDIIFITRSDGGACGTPISGIEGHLADLLLQRHERHEAIDTGSKILVGLGLRWLCRLARQQGNTEAGGKAESGKKKGRHTHRSKV